MGFSRTRPRTATSLPTWTGTAVRRWQQIAARSTVPVITFRGIQEISERDQLLGYNSHPTTPRTRSRGGGNTTESVLGDRDCQTAADEMNLAQYDVHFLLKLGEFLRLQAQDFATQGDYTPAKECYGKREAVLTEFKARRPPPPERQQALDYEAMVQQEKARWEKEMADFDAETERQLEALAGRQEQQRQDLEKKWQTNELERYRKPSAGLIRQRILEADMIHRDQIDRAGFIHQGVKQMEDREHREAQNQYELDYKEAKQHIAQYHKEELEKYFWQRDCERLFLRRKIERKERTFQRRLNVLQTKPPQYASFRDIKREQVASRPVIAQDASAGDPGRKLPMLKAVGGSKPRPQTASSVKKSESTRGRSSSTLGDPIATQGREIAHELHTNPA